ncbi:MAG TPA: hypothetical protein PK176_01535 [Acidobacteriota bacterium]|nr:hypothetical protein [Acidobacteriota bacterium]HQM61971.1 hypothetical protein [Acidobacteriota bacterium]
MNGTIRLLAVSMVMAMALAVAPTQTGGGTQNAGAALSTAVRHLGYKVEKMGDSPAPTADYWSEMQRMGQIPPNLARHTASGYSAVCVSSRGPTQVVIGLSLFHTAADAEERLHAIHRFRQERLRTQAKGWVGMKGEIRAGDFQGCPGYYSLLTDHSWTEDPDPPRFEYRYWVQGNVMAEFGALYRRSGGVYGVDDEAAVLHRELAGEGFRCGGAAPPPPAGPVALALKAEAPGWLSADAAVTADALPSSITVTGTVRGADGSPIAGARVRLPRYGAAATTDALGAYRLAAADRGERPFAAQQDFTLRPADSPVTVELAVAECPLPVPGDAAVTVQARAADGRSLEDHVIRVSLEDADGREARYAFVSFGADGARVAQGRLDARGAFRTSMRITRPQDAVYSGLFEGRYDLKHIPWQLRIRAEVLPRDPGSAKVLGAARQTCPLRLAPLRVLDTLLLQAIEDGVLVGRRKTGLRVRLDSEIPFDLLGELPCDVRAFVDASTTPAATGRFTLKPFFTNQEIDALQNSANLVIPADAVPPGRHVVRLEITPGGGTEVNTTEHRLAETEWKTPRRLNILFTPAPYNPAKPEAVRAIGQQAAKFLEVVFPVAEVTDCYLDDAATVAAVQRVVDTYGFYSTMFDDFAMVDGIRQSFNLKHPDNPADFAVGVYPCGVYAWFGENVHGAHSFWDRTVLNCDENSVNVAHEIGHAFAQGDEYAGLWESLKGETKIGKFIKTRNAFDGRTDTFFNPAIPYWINFMGEAGVNPNIGTWVDSTTYNAIYSALEKFRVLGPKPPPEVMWLKGGVQAGGRLNAGVAAFGDLLTSGSDPMEILVGLGADTIHRIFGSPRFGVRVHSATRAEITSGSAIVDGGVTVSAGNVTLTPQGTRYAVSVADDGSMTVQVLRGAVEVTAAAGQERLAEGQARRVDPAGRIQPATAEDPAELTRRILGAASAAGPAAPGAPTTGGLAGRPPRSDSGASAHPPGGPVARPPRPDGGAGVPSVPTPDTGRAAGTPPADAQTPAPRPEPSVALPGRVLALGLDEATGVITRGEGPAGIRGILQGNPERVNARRGRGVSFDGRNDWILMDPDPALDITGALTVMVLARVPAAALDADLYMMVWRGDEQGGKDPYALSIAGSQLVFRRDFPRTVQVAWPLADLATDEYHVFCGVHRAEEGTLELWVDGTRVAIAPAPKAVGYPTGGMRTLVGAMDNGKSQFFRGILDEVRLFARALNADEIAAETAALLGEPVR